MPWKHLPAERLGIALAILAAAGFSLKAIFVKLAYAAAPVDAITLLALRMGFTLPVVLWVLAADRHGLRALGRRDWGLLAALGLLGYYGASILDFLGLQYISAGLERLILFTYPTLTVLIGVLALGRRLERRQLVALGLSYAGIALAFAHDLRLSADSGAVVLGAALVFGSALSYALYSAGAEVAIKRLGAVRFSALAILVSTLATQAPRSWRACSTLTSSSAWTGNIRHRKSSQLLLKRGGYAELLLFGLDQLQIGAGLFFEVLVVAVHPGFLLRPDFVGVQVDLGRSAARQSGQHQ